MNGDDSFFKFRVNHDDYKCMMYQHAMVHTFLFKCKNVYINKIKKTNKANIEHNYKKPVPRKGKPRVQNYKMIPKVVKTKQATKKIELASTTRNYGNYGKMHACPTPLTAAFFGWEIASPAEFVYDKTQSQFMNKSINMESKEREIERDRENRRRRSEVRQKRERLRGLANKRHMCDEQREKEQKRVPKKTVLQHGV